jgi:hypothetical protein
MKKISLIVVVLILCLTAIPTFAGDFNKKDLSRGDFIELKNGGLYWVQSNHIKHSTELRQWQFQQIIIGWYMIEKKIIAIYKFGTPEWCEKAKKYLK